MQRLRTMLQTGNDMRGLPALHIEEEVIARIFNAAPRIKLPDGVIDRKRIPRLVDCSGHQSIGKAPPVILRFQAGQHVKADIIAGIKAGSG